MGPSCEWVASTADPPVAHTGAAPVSGLTLVGCEGELLGTHHRMLSWWIPLVLPPAKARQRHSAPHILNLSITFELSRAGPATVFHTRS